MNKEQANKRIQDLERHSTVLVNERDTGFKQRDEKIGWLTAAMSDLRKMVAWYEQAGLWARLLKRRPPTRKDRLC